MVEIKIEYSLKFYIMKIVKSILSFLWKWGWPILVGLAIYLFLGISDLASWGNASYVGIVLAILIYVLWILKKVGRFFKWALLVGVFLVLEFVALNYLGVVDLKDLEDMKIDNIINKKPIDNVVDDSISQDIVIIEEEEASPGLILE